VAYSFVGWTTTEAMELAFHRDGHIWAAVTAEAVLLGGDEWTIDPATSESVRMWGRRVCVAEEGKPGVILYGVVPGTALKESRDGTRTPAEIP
jgi:hypothetical protein